MKKTKCARCVAKTQGNLFWCTKPGLPLCAACYQEIVGKFERVGLKSLLDDNTERATA